MADDSGHEHISIVRFLKQWLDIWAINAAAKTLPVGVVPENSNVEAERILCRSDFLSVADIPKPEFTFSSAHDFAFASLRPTSLAANNNLVRGKYFPAAQPSGTVFLVHGWNAEYHYSLGFPRIARHLNRAGLNALMIELPFHCQRRPRTPGVPHNFISEDVALMLKLVEQSLADFQAALHWANETSSLPIAIWGFSLGAWLTGLFCTVSTLPRAAVLSIPVTRMDLAIDQLAFCEPVRRALKTRPLDLSPLNLEKRMPRLAPSNILLVESTYDCFVPSETIADLSRAWRSPAHARVTQSHISILLSRAETKARVGWLKEKLIQPNTAAS
jgi:dienelactone hydrolase